MITHKEALTKVAFMVANRLEEAKGECSRWNIHSIMHVQAVQQRDTLEAVALEIEQILGKVGQ